MIKTNLLRSIATAAIALVSLDANAAPVSIGDPSFEGNTLAASDYSYDLGPEWQETNGPGNGSGFEEYITDFAAEGTDHLGMEGGHDVWQDLAVTYQANTRYTLTVAAGNRNGANQTGNQTTYLLADSTGAIYATGSWDATENVASGAFADAPPLVFDTPNNPAAVGKTLRILLQARGNGRSHFDNIRLDAIPFALSGTATVSGLNATSVTATSATLNGTVTDVGTDAPEITIFWGTGDGGFVPENWQHSVTLPGMQSGVFSTGISPLAPAGTYHFTVRATNSSGVSWVSPSADFETPAQAPTVSATAATSVSANTVTLGADVTSTGGENPAVTIYYGTTNGGTNPGAWASSVSLGTGSGPLSAGVSGLLPVTGYFFRAFAQNSGGSAWSPETLGFTTTVTTTPTVENRDAEGITGTTANLRGEITDPGTSTPTVTVFYGTTDGGTNPGAWTFSASLGEQTGEFSHFVAGLSPTTPYYFRFRAVNNAGTVWSATSDTFTTTGLVPSTAVINEFHYNPLDPTSLEEFIELHNPGDSAIDLSGWTLSNAVTFTFPAGTTLPVGGYKVVAENPAVLQAKYAITGVLGPWTGKLSSKGERIELRDAAGVLKDSVTYGAGFPWPTYADGAGPSAELIHPSLDNDLGGSWRSSYNPGSTQTTYIAAASTGWKYKKGTAEASSPVDAWRAIGYDDSSWFTGQASIGYADNDDNTLITDMEDHYWSLYFRKTFTVPANQIPDTLTLKLWIDDGCVVWINGTEVARAHIATTGTPAYNTAAANHDATAWETFTLTSASSYLVGGTNVIAIHGANSSLSSSDFSMDAQLISGGTGASANPSPGRANGVLIATNLIPPQIRQVSHTPKLPAANTPVTITAKITDPDGAGAVSLLYQTVNPGAYIRKTDATYASSWTTVSMYDNGTNGDAVAGDSVFSAVLPASVQTHRRLVRYKITFADAAGNSLTAPYADDEQPNFAYYVHTALPDWRGAFRPGSTAIQTFPSSVLSQLPVYTLIANDTDVINSQYNSGYDAVRFRGTFVSNGVVYDHIEFKNRGEASTYQSGKNKWRFFFNRARDLPAADNFGKSYSESWGSFSGDACACPWAPLHRGMAGVEEALSYKVFQLAGLPSPNTHYYHFRVVRGAVETPAAGTTISNSIGTADGQYAGDFWGLYLAVEQPDGSFLDERGLPDGNVYKIEGNAGDKKHQASNQPVDSSDWNTFRDAHVNADPTETWWRANMDMDAYHTFHALNRLTGNVDVRGGYNHYFYHRSSDGRWVPIPWDLDMMFIAKNHWTTDINGTSYPGVINAHKSILQQPAIAREYRNRAREIISLIASDATPGGGQIGQLIDEFAQIVNPSGQPLTWADADAAMWNLHPRTTGSDSIASGQGNHKGNFYRTSFADSRIGGAWTRWLRSPSASGTMEHEDSMVYLRDYATNAWPGGSWSVNNGNQLGYAYQYLVSEATDSAAPAKPVISATGSPGFSVNDLTFVSSSFSDPQGAATHAASQWRLAEIQGPGIAGWTAGTARKYEINATWDSGPVGTAQSLTIPLGVAQVGKTYRVRVRHKDTTGNWSYWSEPAQFTATAPPPAALVHYWNFNTPAALLTPTLSIGGGTITIVPAGTFASDTGQGFAAANARNGDTAGTHLRVNNPLAASLTIAAPTTGHENVIVQYETRRSTQGAGTQAVSYSLDGTNFIPFATVTVPDGTPVIIPLDFSAIPAADNNPAFTLRITFQQGTGGVAGNNRFDNLTVEGTPLPGGFDAWRIASFPNPADLADPAISGPNADPSGDGVANLIHYALGTGPYDSVTGLLPTIGKSGGSFEFRFRYDPTKTDLVWRVVATNDLNDWGHVLFDSQTDTIPPLDDGWLPVTLPDHLGTGPAVDPEMFIRLQIEQAD